MKKTKLTRSLLAACSIVALTAVIYGCEGGASDAEVADAEAAAAAAAAADAEAKAKAAADAAAKKAADEKAAAEARAAAEAKARAEAEAAAAAAAAAKEAADAAAAAKAAADAAAAKAAAEAEAEKKAAAEAAAEAAKKAAEEAAAQAETERLAAIEAAKRAIAAATTAAAAQAEMDAVLDQATAAEATELQAAVDARSTALAMMAREAAQRMALRDAAGMIDTSDLSTAAAITAANAAIAALQAALDAADDVSAADKAMYQTQLDTARTAVMTAQRTLDRQGRMMTQRGAISNAVTMARTAVAGVDNDSTDSEVAAADSAIAALEAAIEGAADLAADDPDVASARGTLATLKGTLSVAKASRTAAMEAADKAAAEAAAKLGKDLRAALGGAAANTNALANVTASTLGTAGLDLTVADDAGTLTGTVTVPTLEAGDAAGALGSWMGMDYMHTDTGTKVVNEARVYTNKGPGTTVTFAKAGYTVATATAANDIEGYITLNEADTDTLGRIMGATFTHSGQQDHTYDSTTQAAFTTRGTYDGAPGMYRCTGTCSSTNDGKGSPSALGGVWHFKPDAGAMVHQPDAHYLYYGWWVNKDKDGMPTAASAFAGRVGTDSGDSTDGLDNGWTGAYTAGTTLTGSATYAGHAAGKFAMSNPLDGTGNGGHFTADASLSATFSGTGVGITGTIDNFRLNDGSEDAGWSVSLHRAAFGSDGAISAPVDDAGTADVDEAMGTTWSIDGNEGPRSGTWSGQMYDEAVTGDADDGSNIPTTATGTFYSEFSTIGRMVGAFGADKQ